MDHHSQQADFWKGTFGKEYTDRCTFEKQEWDNLYIQQFGNTKTAMNESFIGHLPKDIRILEVGCNTGHQLRGFQRQGFQYLYGIELQWYAIEKAKTMSQNINFIQGNAVDLPFKDHFFGLVCTNGVLIHIAPETLDKVMDEMYRCTSKYIFGWEYYAEEMTDIDYRGNAGYLWKADYAAIFMRRFPDLQLVKKEFIPFINAEEKGNVNCMYLLEKPEP